jgi:hypothetical protein
MPVTTKPDKMAIIGNGNAEKDEPLIYARNNVMTEPTKAEIKALWRSMYFMAGFLQGERIMTVCEGARF